MTAQFSDVVFYDGKPYSVAGVKGEGLFEPASLGLEPRSSCSACWRGYVCTYAVTEGGAFVLRDLAINLADDDDRKDGAVSAEVTVFGRSPEPPRKTRGPRIFSHIFTAIEAPVAFSGGLLLGDVFIKELYVHMGFHPAWKFRDVHELIFDRGRVVEAHDRSAEMAALRDGITRDSLEPKRAGDIPAWVDRCFSLKYS